MRIISVLTARPTGRIEPGGAGGGLRSSPGLILAPPAASLLLHADAAGAAAWIGAALKAIAVRADDRP
jgi:hypothetical protein